MVFGLDAILPIEFLIPTLRVAKELEWIGHELSNRLTELEQLDEFRLRWNVCPKETPKKVS